MRRCRGRQKIAVLRWGHRNRDKRLTTHVVLTARALGASEFFLTDTKDDAVQSAINNVMEHWGGKFVFTMGKPWRQVIEDWQSREGVVVHLTVYGENIQTSNVLKKIRKTERDLLVIVGSRKVPAKFFSKDVSDFNVAIGNQPHSECSSLAIFLDRFFKGDELGWKFENAKLKIIPQPNGKKVVKS